MISTALRALALAIVIAAAGAADLKPNEALPWCRVTVNLASSIDRDPPVYKTLDGWYDAESRMLFARDAFTGTQPFVGAPLAADTIVKVERAPSSPRMPEQARAIVNRERSQRAAAREKDAKEKAERDQRIPAK